MAESFVVTPLEFIDTFTRRLDGLGSLRLYRLVRAEQQMAAIEGDGRERSRLAQGLKDW